MSLKGDPELYRRGAQLRGEILGAERLQQALADEDDLDEMYHLYGHECCYAQVWGREGLPRLERSLAVVAMLAAQSPRSNTLRVHTRGAVRNGCTRGQLRQLLAMVTWYAGVPVGSEATATMRAALNDIPEPEARLRPPELPAADPAQLAGRGRELRLQVLGAQDAASTGSAAHRAHEQIQDTHYFGVLWANPELSPRHRCLVLLGVLCGSYRMDDAQAWFGAALRLGWQPEELEEFLLTAGAYCGELTYARARAALLAALEAAPR